MKAAAFAGRWAGSLAKARSTKVSVDPASLTLKDGRLHYDAPWPFRIGGTTTSFTGSVGLDQTLDLQWNLPVDANLVRKYPLLDSLQGRQLAGNRRIEQGLLLFLLNALALLDFLRRLPREPSHA